MLRAAWIGAVVAGVYGIVHDQITYSISPEYFTKLKLDQFHYIDIGLGERVFVALVGFTAGSGVGLVMTWFLARRLVPNQARAPAYRQIRVGVGWILACSVLAGALGFAYGLARGPAADYSSWEETVRRFEITDTWSFVRVAYIHNAGYLGACLGLIIAFALLRPSRECVGSRSW